MALSSMSATSTSKLISWVPIRTVMFPIPYVLVPRPSARNTCLPSSCKGNCSILGNFVQVWFMFLYRPCILKPHNFTMFLSYSECEFHVCVLFLSWTRSQFHFAPNFLHPLLFEILNVSHWGTPLGPARHPTLVSRWLAFVQLDAFSCHMAPSPQFQHPDLWFPFVWDPCTFPCSTSSFSFLIRVC